MAIENTIERISPTKKHAGIMVSGVNHVPAYEVFDNLMQRLWDFYDVMEVPELESRLAMPAKSHRECEFGKRGGKEWFLRVFYDDQPNYTYFDKSTGEVLGENLSVEDVFEHALNGVDIDRRDEKPFSEHPRRRAPRKYGHVKIIQLENDRARHFNREWGFDHAPRITDKAKFLVYFSAYGDDKRDSEGKSLADRDAFVA